jgi:glycosyltransferase involved in cell wall biosynthesis
MLVDATLEFRVNREPGSVDGAEAPLSAPKLLIASRVLGASGQPWLWRQILGLDDFQKTLICWERRFPGNKDPLSSQRVLEMAQDPAPYDGPGRWWHRLRNVAGGNFYGARGADARALATVLREERPDAILCYFGDVAMRILPVAVRANVPVIAYLHGDFLFNTNTWYRASLKRCLRTFASFVAVTTAERDWLLRHGVPASKIEIIPCGAPTDLFRPMERAQHGPVRFVMCSRLVEEKGCHLTIRAFDLAAAALRRAGIESALHVYGDGPARGQLEAMVRERGLEETVEFHGYVDEQQIATILPGCDVFVQHSLRKEGSPVSIAEAMACGLPVVTSAVGGIRDQVVHELNGLLFEEHDVDAMAAAMQRLAADFALRSRLGQAGRQRAAESFDSVRQTRRLAQTVSRVLAGPFPKSDKNAALAGAHPARSPS